MIWTEERSQRNSSGFTLLEVIIVLIIIAISSGLVGLYIGHSSGKLKLRTFTKELSATLRYARNHAVSEKQTYCFVVNMDDGMYRLYNSNKDEEGGLIPAISNPIPEEIAVTLNEDTADFYQIEFFPQGNSSGGVIELTSIDGDVLFITINRITGKVEVTSSG
jgi:general secretion pathway protein H